MDLRLAPNAETHDLELVGYDLALIGGLDLMVQRLRQSLWFFRGEWYLDITDGVPYYQDILLKAPDRITVESEIKAAIVETPGVTDLLSFDVEYENAIRRFRVVFSVKTIYGDMDFEEEI